MGKGRKDRHVSGDSEDGDNYIPTPPDGGWGWVIVGASLMTNIIVDGVAYAYGILLPEFESYYNVGKSKSSLIGSILCGVYLCTGPIASALVNRYGCRPVTMVGSVISAIAFFVSMFAPNVDVLIVTYGVFGGFGFGLMYLPSIVSVGFYFEKKRALATGIAVCGSGVGTFVIAPLVEFLLSVYDWKNTLMILSAIMLNGLICGALMRPLEPSKKKKSAEPRSKNALDRLKEQAKIRGRNRGESEASAGATSILERVREAKLNRQRQLQDEGSEVDSMCSSTRGVDSFQAGSLPPRAAKRQESLQRQMSELSEQLTPPLEPPRIVISGTDETDDIDPEQEDTSLLSSPEEPSSPDNDREDPLNDTSSKYPDGTLILDAPSMPKTLTNGIKVRNGENSYGSAPISKKYEVVPKRGGVGSSLNELWNVIKGTGSRSNVPETIQKEDYARPMYRKDIFFSGSIMNFHQFKSQPDVRSYIASITEIPKPTKKEYCLCLPKSVRDILTTMLDVSLFIDPAFLIICLGNLVGMLGFYVPYVLLVTRAVSLGIPKTNAAFLLSIIGIANTIGRVAMGAISDHPRINALWVHNITLVISGIITLLLPVCVTYGAMIGYSTIFGFFVAAYISLTSIILCERLGLEKLTNAFGLLTLVRGTSSAVGPPLAGMVVDITGDFNIAFIYSGILFIVCALFHCLLFLPCVHKPDNSEYMVTQEDEENTPV